MYGSSYIFEIELYFSPWQPRPSPQYPGLQEQLNHSLVLLHSACVLQSWFCEVHSSISAQTLDTFQFGHDFKSWVKILYTNITSCTINNGYASNWFELHRGVRQGCPLSGLLFVLAVEILSIAIQYCAKVMQTKFIKIRPLFLRLFYEKSSNFRRMFRRVLSEKIMIFLENSRERNLK